MDQDDNLTPAFFCVPDITGFTKLIASADINFTKEMIPAILRKLINANMLKMNVAEIEGDAIFFYKTGRLPTINRIIAQCKVFYEAFSNYIASLKITDEENYNKHLAHGELGLKIIVHYGKMSSSNIKGRTKLIGEDIIIVHKLLKNNVHEDEYILFSENYLKRIDLETITSLNIKNLKEGQEVYDYIGTVKYRYIRIDAEAFQFKSKKTS
jgi:hypothetical protein